MYTTGIDGVHCTTPPVYLISLPLLILNSNIELFRRIERIWQYMVQYRLDATDISVVAECGTDTTVSDRRRNSIKRYVWPVTC